MLHNTPIRTEVAIGLGSEMAAVGPGEVIFLIGTWLQSTLKRLLQKCWWVCGGSLTKTILTDKLRNRDFGSISSPQHVSIKVNLLWISREISSDWSTVPFAFYLHRHGTVNISQSSVLQAESFGCAAFPSCLLMVASSGFSSKGRH